MRRAALTAVFLLFAFGAFAGPARAQTFPYDHIHLNAPDTMAASNWYEKYFGGRRIKEAPDRLMFGSTRLLFLQKADAKPSSGSRRRTMCPDFSRPHSWKIPGARASRLSRIRSGSGCITST